MSPPPPPPTHHHKKNPISCTKLKCVSVIVLHMLCLPAFAIMFTYCTYIAQCVFLPLSLSCRLLGKTGIGLSQVIRSGQVDTSYPLTAKDGSPTTVRTREWGLTDLERLCVCVCVCARVCVCVCVCQVLTIRDGLCT